MGWKMGRIRRDVTRWEALSGNSCPVPAVAGVQARERQTRAGLMFPLLLNERSAQDMVPVAATAGSLARIDTRPELREYRRRQSLPVTRCGAAYASKVEF